MDSDRLLNIWLLPWIEYNKQIEFGEITVWSFETEGQKRIENETDRKRLSLFLSHFRDQNDKEMKDIGIVQFSNTPFSPPTSNDNQKVRWACQAIGFSFLINTIRTRLLEKNVIGIGSSGRFKPMQMQIDEEGFLHHYYAGTYGVSELRSNSVVFRQPSDIQIKVDAPDYLMMKLLARVNDRLFGSPLWDRLNVCFEWFLTCWSESVDVSYPARFIALMTAFEAVVRKQGTPSMAKYVTNLCSWDSLPETETHVIDDEITPFNKPGKFIIQFGKYRNNFVHGTGKRLPWGHIKYCIAGKKFDPRQVMSLLIYSAIGSLLVKESKLWTVNSEEEDIEQILLKQELKSVVNALHWSTNEPLEDSPHETLDLGKEEQN
ncbi:MAG TPA: hypothetical protein PKC98_00580 [Candidatus Melainabacteria bacterium]|nr:hypothetical protein [Candidatus Melainabacteria bacterium]